MTTPTNPPSPHALEQAREILSNHREVSPTCALTFTEQAIATALQQRDAEITRLREALGKYGKHVGKCDCDYSCGQGCGCCICGLDAALSPQDNVQGPEGERKEGGA